MSEISQPPETSANTPSSVNGFQRLENLVQIVQNTLTAVVGLGALLTASGYVIVNVSLEKYTDIQSYNVAPAQYLAAGAGYFAILAILFTGIYLFLLMSSYIRYAFLLLSIPGLRVVILAVLIFGILLSSVFYAYFVYPTQLHSFGGGNPEGVLLVFDNAETVQVLGLTSDPAQPRRTGKVLLLAELNNGVLVLDTHNGRVAAVKDDLILARLDDRMVSLEIIPTPSFIPPLSSTATVESTSSP